MNSKEIVPRPTAGGLAFAINIVHCIVANVIGSWTITVMAILTGAFVCICTICPFSFPLLSKPQSRKEMSTGVGSYSDAESFFVPKSL